MNPPIIHDNIYSSKTVHPEIYHSDINYPMTPNITFSVAVPGDLHSGDAFLLLEMEKQQQQTPYAESTPAMAALLALGTIAASNELLVLLVTPPAQEQPK